MSNLARAEKLSSKAAATSAPPKRSEIGRIVRLLTCDQAELYHLTMPCSGADAAPSP